MRRSMLAAVLMLAGCGPTSFVITPVPARRTLTETVVVREGVWAQQKIALIDVDGLMRNSRDRSLLGAEGDNPVVLFKEKLDRAADDPNVKAVVLRINSPGGGVTASDLMYTELRAFRDRTKKPVIACLMDVAASGGYYLACAADQIVAHPTGVTGSIGVIVILPNVTGTMHKIGVSTNVFKSGELKDAGSPFREMTPADARVFQNIVDEMYERFVQVVSRSRSALTPEQVRAAADGRVFSASEAHRLGLVDELGSLPEAVTTAKRAAGLADAQVLVVQYGRPFAHRPNYYAEGQGTVNLIHVDLPDWLSAESPQFLYLWAPGL